MADDTTVILDDSNIEQVPDNIADTELTGLNSAEESTDSEQVEPSQDETEQDQPEPPSEDEPDESDTAEAEEAETTEKLPGEPETPEQPDAKEQARTAYEQRQAAKAQRDYVAEQRQQIREYEQNVDPEDMTERMRVLEAKQYVDTVERNRSSIINDNLLAQSQIPLFNPNTTEFNPKLYERAINRFNESYVVTDPDTGEVLGAQDRNGNNVSLLAYLQQEAQDMSEVLGNTQRQAARAETKMRAKVVTPPSNGKVSSSGDELADLLDKIGDVPLY